MKPPDFTGERYIPGQGSAQIGYEHLHRYLFALPWTRGKRVLDLAAGAGYGTVLLAGAAKSVLGLDIDRTTVEFARSGSGRENIFHLQADAIRLPLRGECFDAVVGFEILEHVPEPERMLAEIARILRPGGQALLSTPNKAVYSDARDYRNPFHVREYYPEEFRDLLHRHFSHVRMFHQQIRAGSHIRESESGREHGEILEQPPAGSNRDVVAPMYMIALCGEKGSSAPELFPSVYLDPTDSMLDELAGEIARLNREIEKVGAWGKDLEKTIRLRDAVIVDLSREIEGWKESIRRLEGSIRDLHEEVERRDSTICQLQSEFDDRSRWALTLQETVAERDRTIREAGRRIEALERGLEDMKRYLESLRDLRSYRWLSKLGLLPR